MSDMCDCCNTKDTAPGAETSLAAVAEPSAGCGCGDACRCSEEDTTKAERHQRAQDEVEIP